MAVSAATKTSDFSGFIPAEIASPIFERAARVSVVQRLVQQVPLGYNGKSIPVTTGRPSAGWVSEGNAKPASSGSMTLKNMSPQKLAAILVVSEEVVRANPGGYLQVAQNSLAEAFAIAFDYAALHDELEGRLLAGAWGPLPRGVRLPAVLAEALAGAPPAPAVAPRAPLPPGPEEPAP